MKNSKYTELMLTIMTISLIVFLSLKWNEVKNNSPILLKVTGDNNFNNEDIVAFDFGDKSNLFKINLKTFKENIESKPHIKDSKIFRSFPSKIEIILVERNPIAVILSDNFLIIDSDNISLPYVNFDLTLPVLTNFKDDSDLFVFGEEVQSPSIKTAVRILDQLYKEYSDIYFSISEVSFNENEEFDIILKNGKTRILLGKNDFDLRIKKLNSFKKNIEKYDTLENYKSVDLRYKNQVVVKES
jgi:cell division protein FtsQ